VPPKDVAQITAVQFSTHLPRTARSDILERLHSNHIGVNGCIRHAHDSIYFPGITTAIKEIITKCPVCVRYQTEQQKEPLMLHPAPKPTVIIGTDNGDDESSPYTPPTTNATRSDSRHCPPSRQKEDRKQPATQPAAGQTVNPLLTTRSGRVARLPARYRDAQ